MQETFFTNTTTVSLWGKEGGKNQNKMLFTSSGVQRTFSGNRCLCFRMEGFWVFCTIYCNKLDISL